MWKRSSSLVDRSGDAPVVVELWEVAHDETTITFATSLEPLPGADDRPPRRLRLAEIVSLQRSRQAGERWTRTLVTLPGWVAQREGLAAYRPRVYVDRLRVRVGGSFAQQRIGQRYGHEWCHLWCAAGDDAAEDDLHRIAMVIGLRREWFQAEAGFPHYDLTPPKRASALRAGAAEAETDEHRRR